MVKNNSEQSDFSITMYRVIIHITHFTVYYVCGIFSIEI